MTRLIPSALLATGVSLMLFFGMHLMVSPQGDVQRQDSRQAVIDFVRLKKDSRTQLKERRKKEPPKPKKPQMPDTAVSNQQPMAMQSIPFTAPSIAADLGVSSQSFLGDATVGMGFGDSDVIPLVRMDATYPRKALSRKIEGYVTARLSINPQGTVDDVDVLDAKPRGVFEREAVKALYKYKFRPKMVDGKPIEQQAVQTIEFNLGDKS